VALQSLEDLGRLTYRRFPELFRHMVGLLGRVISPSQGLCIHRTTQHRNTRINIHALSGIQTHDPSNQPAKTHASDRTATVTGILAVQPFKMVSKLPRTYTNKRRQCCLIKFNIKIVSYIDIFKRFLICQLPVGCISVLRWWHSQVNIVT
jgi:hypothetical protein